MNYVEQNKEQYNNTVYNYDVSMASNTSTNYWVEYPNMKKLIGNVNNLNILDLCCGTGRYSILCAKNNANVTGIDISNNCIELAKQKSKNLNIDFQVIEGEQYLSQSNKIFDKIICGMGVEYFSDLSKLFKNINSKLKLNREFIFSIVHPMRTSGQYIKENDKYSFKVFNYFNKHLEERTWKSIKQDNGNVFKTIKYLYTFEQISEALANSGFVIERILESKPPINLKKFSEDMYNRLNCCPTYATLKVMKIKEI